MADARGIPEVKVGNLRSLLKALRYIDEVYGIDQEASHSMADLVLLAFVGNDKVTALHVKLSPWYA